MTSKKNSIVVDPVEVELKTKMDNLVEDIKELDVKLAETDALFESKVAYMREQRDDRVTILNTAKLHKETQLLALFEQVPQAETKTQRKVALLSGDVVVKKPTQKIEYDSKKLLGWAKENGYESYIEPKVTEQFKWSEFKASLQITDDGILDTLTGELLVVDGLSVSNEPEKLVIK